MISVYVMIYKHNKILLGQTHKGFGNLGGKTNKTDKSIYHIGIREVLEELFDWEDLFYKPRKFLTPSLLNDIVTRFLLDKSVKTYSKGKYHFIYLPVSVFNNILEYLSTRNRLTSVYYKHGFPKNVDEAINDRFPGLVGFDKKYKNNKHFEEYSKILDTFEIADYLNNEDTTLKTISTYLSNISKRIGKVSYKKKVESRIVDREAYFEPDSILLGMYNTESLNATVVGKYLKSIIPNPIMPIEIRALEWIDINDIKTEDKRLEEEYGIGLAEYISEDIKTFKTNLKV